MRCKSGIYKITNTVNGKIYVGSSKDISKRISKHKWQLVRKVHENTKLLRSWEKYGEECFEFSILEYVEDLSILLVREQHYITTLDTCSLGFNICPTAGSHVGRICSEETKRKIGMAHLGSKRSEASRSKMSLSATGKVPSAEAREKISKFHKGRKRSQETRRKISESRKGIVFSEETRRKMSESAKRRCERDDKTNTFS